jgi:hypothetical protein
MVIGTIVEGPTDRLVLQAILDRLCPGEHLYLPLQPSTTFGETGTGWKGVRRFCREIWQRDNSSLEKLISGATGPAMDLLVIHVDADIAAEADLQEGTPNPVENVQQPCPPAADTVKILRQVVARWLNVQTVQTFPPQVIAAIPAQDTETWTFAALFPNDPLCGRPDYECLGSGKDHPAYRLTLKKYGKRLQRTNGEPKKSVRRYRDELAPRIATSWEVVCERCSQARDFTQEVRAKTAREDTAQE